VGVAAMTKTANIRWNFSNLKLAKFSSKSSSEDDEEEL
jgi:hypothetical protein